LPLPDRAAPELIAGRGPGGGGRRPRPRSRSLAVALEQVCCFLCFTSLTAAAPWPASPRPPSSVFLTMRRRRRALRAAEEHRRPHTPLPSSSSLQLSHAARSRDGAPHGFRGQGRRGSSRREERRWIPDDWRSSSSFALLARRPSSRALSLPSGASEEQVLPTMPPPRGATADPACSLPLPTLPPAASPVGGPCGHDASGAAPPLLCSLPCSLRREHRGGAMEVRMRTSSTAWLASARTTSSRAIPFPSSTTGDEGTAGRRGDPAPPLLCSKTMVEVIPRSRGEGGGGAGARHLPCCSSRTPLLPQRRSSKLW
jgi:hypothetical protein